MTFSGQKSVQKEEEIQGFIDLLIKHNVKSYLEIGCGHGDTFHRVMSALPVGSKGVTVDLPESCWGLNDSKNFLELAAWDLQNKGYDITTFFGSSRDTNIIDQVRQLAPFDAILIDGDHSYEGVKADTINYAHMGKIIAFHDIADSMRPNRKGEKIEVPLFWKQLSIKHETAEFIAKDSDMGIGVILDGVI